MKKPILLTAFGLAAAFTISYSVVYSYITGAPAAHTGAPGDVSSCVACHTGTPVTNNAAVTIALLDNGAPVNEYVPGKTYDVRISVIDHSVNHFGFQSTVKKNNTFTGSITESASDVRFTDFNTNYVTHTDKNSTSHGEDNWTYQWTAPAVGTGEVKIYSAVNAANNNNHTAGDKIYLNNKAVAEGQGTAIAENLFDQNLRMWPNPVKDFLTVDYVMNTPGDVAVDIYTLDGKLISNAVNQEQVTGNDRVYVDMTKLQTGVYVVKMTADNQSYSRKIFKTSF